MKNILFFILMSASAIITGCGESEHRFPYRYAHREQVPDSLRDDMAKFITETMRASDQHLTTSDYEDVDDVVSEITHSAFRVYTTSVAGLEHTPDDGNDYWKFIPFNQLTDKQKIIFDSLKVNQQ